MTSFTLNSEPGSIKGLIITGNVFKNVFIKTLEVDFDARLAGIDKHFHPFLRREFLVSEMKEKYTAKYKSATMYPYLDLIQSVLILEERGRTNKCWYKCFVAFSDTAKSYGWPSTYILFVKLTKEQLALFIDYKAKLSLVLDGKALGDCDLEK